jgi:hypothetical protein
MLLCVARETLALRRLCVTSIWLGGNEPAVRPGKSSPGCRRALLCPVRPRFERAPQPRLRNNSSRLAPLPIEIKSHTGTGGRHVVAPGGLAWCTIQRDAHACHRRTTRNGRLSWVCWCQLTTPAATRSARAVAHGGPADLVHSHAGEGRGGAPFDVGWAPVDVWGWETSYCDGHREPHSLGSRGWGHGGSWTSAGPERELAELLLDQTGR